MASYDDTATVSGSVVSIEDGADGVPTKSLVVTIPPMLSGKSEVTETQTGRNLVALNVSPQQAKRDFGITVNTQTADTLNITTTGVTYACERLFYSFKKGTYAVKFLATSSDSFTPVISIYRTNGTGVKFNIQPNTLTTFTLADDTDIDIRLFASGSGDTTVRTVEFSYLQIEVGSTVSTYSQYNSTVYTASLGRTIYGGTADIVNGQGTEQYKKVKVSDLTWQKSTASGKDFFIANISEQENANTHDVAIDITGLTYVGMVAVAAMNDKSLAKWLQSVRIYDTSITSVSDLLSAYGNGEIVFYLKDELQTDFTFTGQEVPTRLGYNAFWSEQGNTELTYYKSGYGFTSVTVHKETPDGEPVEETRKLHRIVYGGQADVVRGTCEPKNLIELYTRASHNGVNYSINADGSLHREGTASPSTSFNNGNATTYSACPYKLSKGTYTITVWGNQASGGYLSLGMRKTDDTQLTAIAVIGNTSKTFTVDEDVGAWYWIFLPNGVSINDDVYVQLEKGSESTEYAPYFEPFSFPPISISTDEGENTLFANEGASAITYRKDTE